MFRTPLTSLLRLGAALVALMVAVSAAPAGPVDATAPPGEKNEMIEMAGAAFAKGQWDDAYKLLQEAVKKSPQLPPAR